MYTAISSYCLVAILGHDLGIERTTYEILQVLGISLLDKNPVKELFSKKEYQEGKEQYNNQLTLSLF